MTAVALKDVCQITNGGTPKSGVENLWHGGVAWLTPAEMGKRLTPYIAQTARTISQDGLANSSAKLVPPFSVILSTRAPIGHLAINETPMAFNQGCRGLTPNEKLDTKYLYYFLLFSREALDNLGTGTTFKELSSTNLANFQIPLPPLEEQQRIVSVLDKAFAGIATATTNAQKNLTNARALFESFLEAIATGQGDGWAVTPLGDVCETQYGISGTMNTSDVGYKIFRMGEVQDGRMIDTGQMKHIDIPDTDFETYRLRKGDVLFNRTNSIALVGKTGVFSLDGQYCFASYLIRVKFDAKKMSSRFAGYVMNSKSFLERVRAKAAQSVNQANINATILRAEVISYPVDVAVQDEIVDRLNAFSAHIQSLQLVYQKKLTSLTELKQSLLRKAFAGELT